MKHKLVLNTVNCLHLNDAQGRSINLSKTGERTAIVEVLTDLMKDLEKNGSIYILDVEDKNVVPPKPQIIISQEVNKWDEINKDLQAKAKSVDELPTLKQYMEVMNESVTHESDDVKPKKKKKKNKNDK